MNTSEQINRLASLYPEFADDLHDALAYADMKPDIALFKLGRIMEAVIKAAYTSFTERPLSEDTSTSALLAESTLATQIPRTVLDAIYTLKRDRNTAVHQQSPAAHQQSVTSDDAWRGLLSIRQILEWSSNWWDGGSRAKKWKVLTRPLRKPVRIQQPVTPVNPLAALLVLFIGTPILAIAGAGITMLLEYFFMYRSLMNATGPTGPAKALIIVGAFGGAVIGLASTLKIFRDGP